MSEHESRQFDIELPNVGHGSDRVQAGNLVGDGDCVLVVLLGSHYCPRSRELVRELAEHHDAFRRRDTTVVPVLPDIRQRARLWDRQYDLPFPMLADPADGEDTDTFGVFEPLQESLADRPAVALYRVGDEGLGLVATAVESELTVPVVESLLTFVERHRATDATTVSGNAPADS